MSFRMKLLFALIATALVKFWFTLRSRVVSIFLKSRTRRRARELTKHVRVFEALQDELIDTRDQSVRRVVVSEMVKCLNDHRIEQRATVGSCGRTNKDQTAALLVIFRNKYQRPGRR